MGRQLLAVPQAQVNPAELTVKLNEYTTREEEEGRGIKADTETSSKIEELTEESKTEEKERDWIDNIKDSIPVEVVAAWTAIFAIFTGNPGLISSRFYLGTIILGSLATALHMWSDINPMTEEEQKRLEYTNTEVAIRMWFQILLAVGAFLAWVYSLQATNSTLQSPVEFIPFNDAYAAVLLPLYLLLGPQLLPEVLNKLHDMDFFKNYDAITASTRRKSRWFMFISLVGMWILISSFGLTALSGANYWNALVKYIVGDSNNFSEDLFEHFSTGFAKDSPPKLEQSEIR
ncbi:hypothetical protein, partial [Haladaptatus sp. NG-SE-30]